MKKIILFIICSIYLNNAVASSTSGFWLGSGTVTHNFLSAQKNTTGSKKVFEFAPIVIAGATLPYDIYGLYFSPAIGYAKFYTKDNTTRTEFIIQYHFNQPVNDMFQMRYGFSNYITKLGGDGSTVTLNNGSSTASFYVPKQTKTSYTASMDVGSDLFFTNEWAMRLEFSVLRFLSSTHRRVSHLLTVNYNF